MTKTKYLARLQKYLRKLPAQDYTDAMEYFTEYFEEADEAEAQQLMEELGSPKEAAREIMLGLLDKQLTAQNDKPPARRHTLWLTVLLICALPIGVPLLIALCAVLLAVAVCIAVAIVCVFIFAFCLFVAGGKLLVRGLLAVPFSVSGAAMIAGVGLLGIGVGILCVVFGIYLCKGSYLLLVKLARWLTAKKRRSNQ